MGPFKNILHPTDFSSCAQAAMPIASALARDYRTTLILVHVRAESEVVMGEFGTLPPEPRESDEAVKLRMRQLVPPEFRGPVQLHVRRGDAANMILALAQEHDAGMIVLGTHGRSGIARLLVGSVAEAIMRGASCPVLAVKTARAPLPESRAEAAAVEPTLKADDLATVATVASPVEAEVIRNALKDNGIRAFIEGETQAGVVGILGIPVKVQVRVADFDRASKLIRSHDQHRRR